MKTNLIFQYEKSRHECTQKFPCRIHAMDQIMHPELIIDFIPNDFPMAEMWRVEECLFNIENGKICQTAYLFIYN